jgi:hypothetical protein
MQLNRRAAMMRRVAFALLGTAAALMSCGPDFTGPNSSRARFGALAINPTLPTASQVSGGDVVPFTNVRIVLRRSDQTIAIDTVVAFPSNAEEISLAISVPLSNSVTSDGEPFSLTMEYRNAAGDVVFRAGPVVVLIVPFVPGGPPPTPVDVPADYVGTGSQATRVEIQPTAITLLANQTTTFTAQAFDVDVVLPGTPVFFTTSNAAIVDVTTAGLATAKNVRGTATITANLLTGQTANATVTVDLPASSLTLVSGNNQTGTASAALASPVVVRAIASDAVGVAGVTVTFAAANGGNVGATTVVTDAQGNAQTTWTLGVAAGAQTLTATAAGLVGSPITFTATVASSAATSLAFTTQPANSVAGVAVGGPITVTARDAGGNVATSFNGSIALGLGQSPGGATLGGTTVVTAVNGVATFTAATLTLAGTYTLTAQSTGLTAATSNTFTVSPAAASQLVFTAQPSDALADAVITPAIQVSALDAFANLVTLYNGNVTLGLGQAPGGAVLGGTATVAAVGGIATFANSTLNIAGTYSLTAQATGLITAASNQFAITSVGATQLAFTTQPVDGVAGFISTVTVTARDAGGNVAPSFTGNVTLGLGQSPAGATIGGTFTVAAVNGVATFTTATLGVAGTYTLTAQASGLTPATSNTFTISPSTAFQAIFIVQPSDANAGAPIVPAMQVAVQDAFGNTITSFANPVTLVLNVNPTGATLIGTTTVNAVAGIATFPTVGVSTVGTGYRLVASVPGLSSTPSVLFNVGVSTIAWTNAAGGAWETASNWNLNRVPQTGDSIVITLAGDYTVTMASNQTVSSVTIGAATGTQSLSLASSALTVNNRLLINGNGVLELAASSVAGAGVVANSGLISVHGGVSISNPITTVPGSSLRVEANGTYGFASLNHVVSFTNNGTLELTSVEGSFGATLTSSAGTFTNAGLVLSNTGTGGLRTLGSTFTNEGTLTAQQPLIISESAVNANTGTINALSDILFNYGPADVFTNLGSVSIAPSFEVAVTSGAFNHNGGSIFGGGTLTLTNLSAAFGVNFSNATAGLAITSSTVTGPGFITNAVGQTLIVSASNLSANLDIVNQGTLVIRGAVNMAGDLTTFGNSTVRIEGDNVYGFAEFATIGFVNAGTIDLTSVAGAFPVGLTLVTGTLVNPTGATILSSAGTGGGRIINGAFDNSGTITVNQTLALNGGNGAYSNNGTIELAGGDLAVTQQSAGTFSNAGALTIGAARTLTINGGRFNQDAGAITGAGTLSLINAEADFSTNFSTAETGLALNAATLDGSATITNASGRTLTLDASAIGPTASFNNQGTLVVHGESAVSGAFTTSASSIIRIEGISTYGFATLQAPPFTNTGRIELTSASGAFPATLSVLTGQLTNGVGATLESMPGSGGARIIDAQVLNESLITVNQPLSMPRANAVHSNTGTIDLAGADMSFTPGTGSLTNVGAMLIGAGHTLSITGGTFVQNGSLTGSGTLALSDLTATLIANFTNATTTLELNNSIVNGPGAITNAAGRTLMLRASTIGANALLLNSGLLVAHGASAVNGGIITSPGSTIRVEGNNTFGFSTLTFVNGFQNDGAIELTSSAGAFPAEIVVLNGSLQNVATRTIASLVGTGGARTITAQLLNNGTLTVDQPLSVAKPSAGHSNTGTIDLAGADLSFPLGGGSLANSGTLSIGAGRLLTVSGGEFNQNAGTIAGDGTLLLSAVAATFQTDFTNATTTLEVDNSVVNGPGTITNAAGRTLMLRSSTIGAGALLINNGLLLAHGNSAVNSSIVTTPTSTIRVEGINTFGFATLTVTNGFQNNGAIELTSSTGAFPALLDVLGGELANAVGATISSLPGTGGARTIDAQLNNGGTLAVGFPLSLTEVNAIHSNTGAINITGGDLTQTTGTLNNSGSITIDAGFSLIMNGAILNQAGTLTGAGTLNLTGVNVSLGVNFDNVLTNLALTSTTVSGPGTLTNAAGRTLTLNASTIDATAPFVNLGTLVVHGGSSINGSFSAPPGSTLRVEGINTYGFATLTVANELTNGGTIELTSATGAFPATLIVSTGMLTNAVGGKIVSMPGTAGSRTLNAQLANLGDVNVDAPLTLVGAPDVVHANVGTINVNAGDMSVTQSGVDAAFGNTGTIAVSSGFAFGVTGGSFIHDAIGAVSGAGSLSLNGVQATFNTSFTNATTALLVINSEITSIGTITNAPGKTLVLDNTEFTGLSTFANQGLVVVRGNSAFNGALTTTPGSTIRVEANNTYGFGILSIANTFTNAGAIELTSVNGAFPADIAVAPGAQVLSLPGSSVLTLEGTGGARTFNGEVIALEDLTLTPGFFGKFTMTTTALTMNGKFNVEIGGVVQDTDYDRLAVVGGGVVLGTGATLNVSLINGFVPKAGDTFTILTYQTGITGQFVPPTLPTLPVGLGWGQVQYTASGVILTVNAQ